MRTHSVSMFCSGKRSGLSTAVAAVVVVIALAAAGAGVVFATPRTTTQTVTQTVTQSATVTTTVTFPQTPTANNPTPYSQTLDLRAYTTQTFITFVVLAGEGGDPIFLIGPLVNPTIIVKTGTHVHIDFRSDVSGGLVAHSFVIVNSKPPFASPLSQSDVTPVFVGASTADPIHPQKDLFKLNFLADKPGTYYYISAVDGDTTSLYGMYGQFIVEE